MSTFNFYSCPFNFVPLPIISPVYNTSPVGASTPILEEEKEDDSKGKKDKWMKAQTDQLVAMWKKILGHIFFFHQLKIATKNCQK